MCLCYAIGEIQISDYKVSEEWLKRINGNNFVR
jgi:hypothetical protein